MQKRTPIIDSQVHAYESNRPERPWTGHLPGPQEVTGDQMVKAMDTVGVDGALLVSPFMLYRYDASYAVEVYAKHPGRFGLIKPFDPFSETLEVEMEAWAKTPGAVGARLMLPRPGLDGSHPRTVPHVPVPVPARARPRAWWHRDRQTGAGRVV